MKNLYSPDREGSFVAPEFLPTEEIREVDAVVVGAGALGLMVAKHLADFGQEVALIEQSETIADGPSIKNHGWLHTGIAHSLSVTDPIQGRDLVRKLQYGHRYFSNYAPECLDEPFEPTYAIAGDPELAARARENWTKFGVPHKELTADQFFEVEPGLDPGSASYFFENGDLRINNRLLFAKMLHDIRKSGSLAILGATYEYEDVNTITVVNDQGRARLRSQLFLYATGTGLDDSYQKLTGDSLGMQYWKSHLLLLPRFTNASIVSLDRETPIVINHGDVSVVNRSYDEVPQVDRDTRIDMDEVSKAFDVIRRFYPRAGDFIDDVHAIACLKPNIPTTSTATRHNVGESIYEPEPGHIFALPGKMTEAPYVAASLVRRIASKLRLDPISRRPIDVMQASTHEDSPIKVTLAN